MLYRVLKARLQVGFEAFQDPRQIVAGTPRLGACVMAVLNRARAPRALKGGVGVPRGRLHQGSMPS